jgi:hypothetical protein
VRYVTVRGEWVYEARGCHGEEEQQGSSRKEDGEEHGRGGAWEGRSSRGGASGGEHGRSTGPASLQHTQVASTTAGCIVEGGCTTTTLHAPASIVAAAAAERQLQPNSIKILIIIDNGPHYRKNRPYYKPTRNINETSTADYIYRGISKYRKQILLN